jgi:hypothetical protein
VPWLLTAADSLFLPAGDQEDKGKLDERMDDRVLLHQVHPLKLAADISASIISNTLLWQHRLLAGIVTRYALPVAGSAIVLSFADVERLRDTAAGRYVLAYMPPSAVAVRFAGDVVMAVASWKRRPLVVALGLLIVAAGWSQGLVEADHRAPTDDAAKGRPSS